MENNVSLRYRKLKKDGKNINALIDGFEAPAESRKISFKLNADDFAQAGGQLLEDMEKWVRDTAGMELDVPNYEGVRVNYKVPPANQGWFLLRKSLHEPFM